MSFITSGNGLPQLTVFNFKRQARSLQPMPSSVIKLLFCLLDLFGPEQRRLRNQLNFLCRKLFNLAVPSSVLISFTAIFSGGLVVNTRIAIETGLQFFSNSIKRVSARPPGQPPPDYDRSFQACTEGVPLKGNFSSPWSEITKRLRYDNHPAVADYIDDVEAKFAAEEEKSFHVHFLRVVAYFLPALMINPLQWAIRRGKGRICVDCTNGPHPAGSPNSYIPKPSADNPDECPPVYYATALTQFLVWLWRMRMTEPLQDILQHCDDIDAAFWRCLYHPDLAPAFAYVLASYLIIPAGQVFGSRNAPSYFSMTSDLRAHVATTSNLPSHPANCALSPLAASATVPPLPEGWNPQTDLTPALADAYHAPLSRSERDCFVNCTFVDDNGVAAYRARIRDSLHQSLESAYILYGYPDTDRRQSCLNAEKWDPIISHIMTYLGFIIDTRAMTMAWPRVRRMELHDEIGIVLQAPRKVPPKTVASILGKLWSAGRVAPWGIYITHSLQHQLTQALNTTRRSRHFWRRGKVRCAQEVIHDLRLIQQSLTLPEQHPMWTRPIALLVPRESTHRFKSDASYGGIGGWTPSFNLMWRVMRDDLAALGFDMRPLDDLPTPPSSSLWSQRFLTGSHLVSSPDHVSQSMAKAKSPRDVCISPEAASIIFEVLIRFRFDKSRNNFTIRRYQHTADPLLNPVHASINLIRRARILGIPPHEPIGQARSPSGSITCIRDHHVRDTMRAACIRVHPDRITIVVCTFPASLPILTASPPPFASRWAARRTRK